MQQNIVIMFIIYKVTNCVHTIEVTKPTKRINIQRITEEDEIFIKPEQNINEDEVKSFLEEKYKFINDNTSRRFKVTEDINQYSDHQERHSKLDIVFRAIAGRRIVGGMQTSIRMYPYNVAISRHGKHWCGGSIIDEQWVLTAGHCFESVHDGDKKKLYPFIVRAGSSFHDRGGYQARINKVFFPEEYIPGNGDYDFSLLRLDRPMPIGRNIAVVNLPSKEYKTKSEDMLVVTGWGSTHESGFGNMPSRLRFVLVPVIKTAKCQKLYNFYITPRMICAGYSTGGKDACNHDSGGPAIRDGVLLGIVSFGGKKCGDPRSPGVYGRVSEITEWVEETITNNEASDVPELREKIERARKRERELQTFKVQLEEKKMKIKNWLREVLYSSTFIEVAKRKLQEIEFQMAKVRRFESGNENMIDDETLDDINLANLITERILEDDISNERELIQIIALYEIVTSNKGRHHNNISHLNVRN